MGNRNVRLCTRKSVPLSTRKNVPSSTTQWRRRFATWRMSKSASLSPPRSAPSSTRRSVLPHLLPLAELSTRPSAPPPVDMQDILGSGSETQAQREKAEPMERTDILDLMCLIIDQVVAAIKYQSAS